MVWLLGHCHGNIFFSWFAGRNLLVTDQNFKRGGDIKKREAQISREKCLFLFYQSKLMSYFVPVIPLFQNTTLKEMPRIK